MPPIFCIPRRAACDLLAISGGGEKGAFGSGFLDAWGSAPEGEFARPEFDMITGVSTGALIAPFAFIGTDESYSTIVDFYSNPEPNWVKKRGALYFKTGHVSLFITGFPAADGPVARFKERNPGAPLPKVRVWVQINGKIQPEPAVTQPSWPSVAGRSLGTLMASGEIFALNLIRLMTLEVKTDRGLDAEYHIVSIPPDTPPSTSKEIFDKDYMRGLEKLGRTMGADPNSWTKEIPDVY